MRSLVLLIAVSLFTTLLGCTSATPVNPEPLPTDQHSQLDCLLVGTWEHTSSGDTKLMQSARNAYILKADGTGWVQANSGSRAMGVREKLATFDWELEGRNLHMRRDDGQEDVFRVDDWSARQMDWFYYNGSADYGVVRRNEGDVPEC